MYENVPASTFTTVEDHEMVGFDFTYEGLIHGAEFCGSRYVSGPPAKSH